MIERITGFLRGLGLTLCVVLCLMIGAVIINGIGAIMVIGATICGVLVSLCYALDPEATKMFLKDLFRG